MKNIKTREKIIAGILIVVFLCVFYITLDANKYRAEVVAVEGEGRVGVNPTTESLDFGDLSKGTSAVRTVSVKNGTSVAMFIMVWKFGGIGDLMKIAKNNFTLKAGNETKIELTVYMPASAEIGKTYTGRVYLFKIPTL